MKDNSLAVFEDYRIPIEYKEGDIETSDVQEKAIAAIKYCNHATEFNLSHGKKPWKYVLIPHNAVLANMGFDTLMRKYMS